MPSHLMPASIILSAALALAACGTVQTTSGADYLAARPSTAASEGSDMDRLVERAANVEPLLRFPARIGLARIQYGRFVPVPPDEADAWIAFAQTHAAYGSFVPVSPLVGQLTSDIVPAARSYDYARDLNAIVPIRLAAARQHLDAVLVYTVATASKDRSSALSLLDLTIIGAYLVPSRLIEGTAIASGLLFDVRNAYPYATVGATSTAKDRVASVGSGAESSNLEEKAGLAAVQQLAVDADRALNQLRSELAARRTPLAPIPAPSRPRRS